MSINPKFFVIPVGVTLAFVSWVLFAPSKGSDISLRQAVSPPTNNSQSKVVVQTINKSNLDESNPLGIRLAGVAVGVNQLRMGIISVNNKPDIVVRVGDLLEGSWAVAEIDVDSLTYQNDSRKIKVFVESVKDMYVNQMASLSKNKNSASEVVDSPLPGFIKRSPSEFNVSMPVLPNGNAEFRQAVEQKMATLGIQQ